jgi:hypothetical protein
VTPKPTPWGGGREGSLLDPPKPTPKPTPPGGSLLGYPGGTPNRPPKPTPPGGGRIGVSWGGGWGSVPDGRCVRREEGIEGARPQTHVCNRGRWHRSHRAIAVPGWTFSVIHLNFYDFHFSRFVLLYHRVQNTPPDDHAARHICICILQMCFRLSCHSHDQPQK